MLSDPFAGTAWAQFPLPSLAETKSFFKACLHSVICRSVLPLLFKRLISFSFNWSFRNWFSFMSAGPSGFEYWGPCSSAGIFAFSVSWSVIFWSTRNDFDWLGAEFPQLVCRSRVRGSLLNRNIRLANKRYLCAHNYFFDLKKKTFQIPNMMILVTTSDVCTSTYGSIRYWTLNIHAWYIQVTFFRIV